MTSALDLVPEPPRLDRHDTYVGILIYVWFSSIGIYLLPIGTGPISSMDPDQQKLLAICMFLGSTLALFGTAMGEPTTVRITAPMRWLLTRRLAEKIRRHPYSPLPVRHCYRLGIAGLTACVMAFIFFSGTLLTTGSIIGSATGLLPPILATVWTRKIRKMWRAANRMDIEFDLLKREANGKD